MKRWLPIILAGVLCCAAMAVVDGIIQPVYIVKSIIKMAVFLIPSVVISRVCGFSLFAPFRPQAKGFVVAIGMGVGVYALIVGGYFALRGVSDFGAIAGSLSQSEGVDKSNFLYVSLYISLVNSLLEEFFFRGFLFTNLKQGLSRTAAHIISAGLFALYHVAIMVGWFSLPLFALITVGLFVGGVIFNLLNERLGSIYPSWLLHMCANFGINTVGFILMSI